MPFENPFETVHRRDEPDLPSKVRLIAYANLGALSLVLLGWLTMGVVPTARTAQIILSFLMVGALTFASGSLIGWFRLDQTQRKDNQVALFIGCLSFGVAILVLAFQYLG